VFAHLGAPPLAVTLDTVLEALGEGAGFEVLGPSLAFEERPDLGKRQPGILGEPVEVVEVPALDALDDAAKLLGPDLLDWVDDEWKRIGEVWSDIEEEGPYLLQTRRARRWRDRA
jgi:hypothetical protein